MRRSLMRSPRTSKRSSETAKALATVPIHPISSSPPEPHLAAREVLKQSCRSRGWALLFSLTLIQSLIFACVAQAGAPPGEESFRFNPLLDQAPALNIAPPRRRWVDAISGLQAGISGGVYLGAVRSDLTEEYSTLRSGGRAMVGFELGYRLEIPLMLSLETQR